MAVHRLGIVTANQDARLRAMVAKYREFVVRTLATAGVPWSEIDDEVQRTFITAAGRLDDIRLGSERAFLYRVACNAAAHAHRTRRRCREVAAGELPEVPNETAMGASPESLAQHSQLWKLLREVLDRMHESLRAVFVLCDLEGMPRKEIAELLNLPDGTVASRLRFARTQVRTLVAREFASVADGSGRGDSSGQSWSDPPLLRWRAVPSVLDRRRTVG